MLLVAMFVYVAAGAESRATVLRDLLRGMTARDLLSSDVRTVAPGTTVAEFLDRVATERTVAYPVLDGETVTGLVKLDGVRSIAPDRRETTTVADVMGPSPPTVSPEADAFDALRALSESGSDRVLVTADGRLVGQITTADFVTALEVLQGLGVDRDLEMPDGYA
jgi:CBS domain-containing protein